MVALKEHYRTKVVDKFKKDYNYTNIMQIPKITKITVNMGVGEAVADKKILKFAMEDLAKITGQRPIATKAKKSLAGFKIRDGWAIGCKVVLRKDRMYYFLERLLKIALPRVRDFRGLNPKSFDGQGNYSLGLKEQIVFPEIEYDKIDALRGMDITITTSAVNDEEGKRLLQAFNFPLKGSRPVSESGDE